MRRPIILQRLGSVVAAGAVLAATVLSWPTLAAQTENAKERPKLNLRASPPAGFVPARIVFTAELSGGADDYEDYYCAAAEWDWGEGSISSASYDCDPYRAGKTKIRRRFSQEHTFREPGTYDVTFRLKQGSKVVAAVKLEVEVRGDRLVIATGSAPAARARS